MASQIPNRAIFDLIPVVEDFFSQEIKLNCAAAFGGGRRIVYGTQDGIYVSNSREPADQTPVKLFSLARVKQVEVLEDCQVLIVLSQKSVIIFPLDTLDLPDLPIDHRRGQTLSHGTTFFASGTFRSQRVLCLVKPSMLSTTFKLLEPETSSAHRRRNEYFRIFREFYLPTEARCTYFTKTKICVGCWPGRFDVVDPETLDTQVLLDPDDPALAFVRDQQSSKPIGMYAIRSDYLICYDKFAFFIDKVGRRIRADWKITWEGKATATAFQDPHLLIFEPKRVNIFDIETATESGPTPQVIQAAKDLQYLFSPPSYPPPYIMEPSPPAIEISPPPSVDCQNDILLLSDNRVLALRFSAQHL